MTINIFYLYILSYKIYLKKYYNNDGVLICIINKKTFLESYDIKRLLTLINKINLLISKHV